MNCPHCKQTVEDGASFCGNCGQALLAGPSSQTSAAMPTYAVSRPGQHTGETKALLSLLFGLAGLAGALLMAVVGLAMGVAGIAMGTMSRSSKKRSLSTAGLVVSVLAVIVSLAVWSYAVSQNSHPKVANNNSPATVASHLSTPCYSADLVETLNVSQSGNDCNASAFDGSTLNSSANVYKVYAASSGRINDGNFKDIFKQAIEKDLKTNLPNFTVNNETAGLFAGSPAYIAKASDKRSGVSVVEGAVWHKAVNGDNVFVLVHAAKADNANLDTLEAQWQWQ